MLLRLLLAACLSICPAIAYAAQDDIPEHLQGKWVDRGESCDASGQPIVISATSMIYPDGRLSAVYFASKDSAIRIHEEGTNYEYVEGEDLLVFHPEGFGMGSAFPMVRCPEPIGSASRRCGWLANLAPGDWWLVDGDRTWVLAKQGDDNAATTAVMDRVPAFDTEQFVRTGNYYGYSCACLTAVADGTLGRITAIVSSQRLTLATCKADETLPVFGSW
jgi:hypothetical protein